MMVCCRSNVGNAVDEIHLFYTEVEDHMKTEKGLFVSFLYRIYLHV